MTAQHATTIIYYYHSNDKPFFEQGFLRGMCFHVSLKLVSLKESQLGLVGVHFETGFARKEQAGTGFLPLGELWSSHVEL